MSEVEHVLSIQNEAGESPHWNADEQALYWADIVDPHLYRYFPAEDKLDTFDTMIPITGLGLQESGGLVVASKSGLYLLDQQLQESKFLHDPEVDKPNVRFNDGLVDPRGRYWAGTLNEVDFTAPDGALYRLDPDGSLNTMDIGLKGPNGIAWSPDCRIMYLVDSFDQVIYAYDYELEAGEITNRRIFVEVPAETGIPDGRAILRRVGLPPFLKVPPSVRPDQIRPRHWGRWRKRHSSDASGLPWPC